MCGLATLGSKEVIFSQRKLFFFLEQSNSARNVVRSFLFLSVSTHFTFLLFPDPFSFLLFLNTFNFLLFLDTLHSLLFLDPFCFSLILVKFSKKFGPREDCTGHKLFQPEAYRLTHLLSFLSFLLLLPHSIGEI